MSGYIQTNSPERLVDADVTIELPDSGKLFLIPVLAANRVITLPDPAEGAHFRFMTTATLTHSATITATGLVCGLLINNNAGTPTAVAKASANSAVLTATSVKGDFVDVYCDGAVWHVSGMSGVAAGLS